MSIRSSLAWRTKLLRSTDNIHLKHWLRDRGSLTARIQARGRFEVRLLRQGLAMPTLDEAMALGIKSHHFAWVREVALLWNDEPVVFAHTVLAYKPRGSMTRWLARLGNRSLGALFFAHAGFSRGEIKCKRLDNRHRLFHPAINAMQLETTAPAGLWARRSCFTFGAQSALVTEIFSPTICAE